MINNIRMILKCDTNETERPKIRRLVDLNEKLPKNSIKSKGKLIWERNQKQNIHCFTHGMV